MQNFSFFKKENHLAFTRTRNGEIKIGEKIKAVSNTRNWKKEMQNSAVRFVIVGIPEDIGVKANLGTGGTQTAWSSFLQAFFNMQHNPFLDAGQLLLLGYFDFSAYQKKTIDKPVEYLRDVVAAIDKQVADCIRQIVAAGKIPVIIGGGHNNAFGNIKGAAEGLFAAGKIKTPKINVINLDAHADFRALEGRHSGNGFSYAMQEGHLNKYGIVGLHENYMTQSMLERIQKNKNIQAHFYEDIAVRGKSTFSEAVSEVLQFTKTGYTGIEIDLDAMENVLSSAVSPAGFSLLQARQFVHQAAASNKIAYLHICEGASELDNGLKSSTTGKLIAYLVSDFMKAINVTYE
ncbi:MAG: formimidoylglutamase [Sphingobacteriales bacterium]|jgi:formiminoglutamase|nr:formimidoylglutamase [Sphingobacteriales bacterium]